jgi:hypothetical protein
VRYGCSRAVPWTLAALVAIALASAPAQSSAEPVTTIRAWGVSANRVDLVILGDGYTESELDQYASDVETFVQALFSQEPFREYQRYFNVHRVDVVSNESGADHPEQSPPLFKDTALDATYNCAGIQRLICVNSSNVNTVLARSIVPDMRDLVLIIVNDPTYGGSGGAFAVASVHPEVVEIILHELGHSFGLLADEYGGPPPPDCNASVEPPEPNATKESDPELIKWRVWIDPSTPVPTAGATVSEPGLYESAKYCDTGLFRPTYDSKMRSLNQPFEQINSEQLVKRVYNWASPIDAVEPSDTMVTLTAEESRNFSVETLEPFTQSLNIIWNVDGQPYAAGKDFTLNASTLTPGLHTVEVVVSDLTPLVRNDPARVLTETRHWDVIIAGPVLGPELVQVAVSNPPQTAQVGTRFRVTDTVRNDGDTAAAPSTTRFYLSTDIRRNKGDRRLIGTRAVPELNPSDTSTGTTRVRIPLTVSAGTYFLLACADNTRLLTEADERNNCRPSEIQIQVTIDP